MGFFDFLKKKTPDPLRIAASSGYSPAGGDEITIQYRNHRGEERSFTGDARTARRVKNHVSIRVSPRWQRVALSRDRLLNLADVDAALARYPRPSRVEMQILGYYRKHGKTSPRYEELLAKYPHI